MPCLRGSARAGPSTNRWFSGPVSGPTPHGFDVQFGDHMVMCLALADPAAALPEFGQVSDRSIDGANSGAYVTAWLLSRASAA